MCRLDTVALIRINGLDGGIRMIYIISDLHGDLKKIKQMLKLISFDHDRDKLIINGDIMDRGKDDLKILEFITPYIGKSVELILGNHEFFCMQYLKSELERRTWIRFGAESSTIDTIDKLSDEDKTRLYQFLSNLPHYIEVQSNDMAYVITHAGLHADYLVFDGEEIDVVKSIEEGMRKDMRGTLISIDLHNMPSGQKRKLNRTLVVGHVPVFNLNGEDRIIKHEKYICIDGGVGKGIGGCLACLRLEDGEEFYVS